MTRQEGIDASRQDMVLAGARSFSEVGFEAATMLHISRNAGISEETLYSEFPTKSCLAEEILRRSVRELDAAASELSATEPATQLNEAKTPILQELVNACSKLVDLLREGDTIQAASARLTLDGGDVAPDSWNGLLLWVKYVEGILCRSRQAGELLNTPWTTQTTAEHIVTIFAGQHQYSRTVGNINHLGELLPALFETILPTIAKPTTRLKLRMRDGTAAELGDT
ncbi:TetR family transcriptional regulator [Streptomyces sp. NPDC059122]|uniref:TetR family transcriptional regulator n=1 Tax=Streptomyces sp. NPDC059122 TaxID=3346732 RepID=UPI003677401E